MKTESKKVGPFSRLSMDQRIAMIEEYLRGNVTKQQIWKKYTGEDQEYGHLLRWMRKLGYLSESAAVKKSKTGLKPFDPLLKSTEISPDPNQLQNYIQQLQKELEAAELRAEGYDLMIELAEKEFAIPLRKKFDTK